MFLKGCLLRLVISTAFGCKKLNGHLRDRIHLEVLSFMCCGHSTL